MSMWAVWQSFDNGELHIAPCDESGDRVVGHHDLSGDQCWCTPRRDAEFPDVIVHQDRERGGFNA